MKICQIAIFQITIFTKNTICQITFFTEFAIRQFTFFTEIMILQITIRRIKILIFFTKFVIGLITASSLRSSIYQQHLARNVRLAIKNPLNLLSNLMYCIFHKKSFGEKQTFSTKCLLTNREFIKKVI